MNVPPRLHRFLSFLPFIFFLVPGLLLLSACGGPPTQDYHTGSEGLALSFADDTPPAEVYEGSVVPVFLEVWNKGAWNVPFNAMRLTLRTNPFYANVTKEPAFDPVEKRYADSLFSKQPGYSEGERRQLAGLVTINSILGTREQPSSKLFATICYPYATTLGTTVCVDANAYNQNRQQQVCQAETLTYRDQGAPVAVTIIENRPTPLRVVSEGGRGFIDLIQPTFIVHVKNVGQGSVLMPTPEEDEARDAACAGVIPPEQLNRVGVNATLSGHQLACDPNPVPLQRSEGYTTCVLPPGQDSKGLTGSNYLAVLLVKLNYLYRNSVSAPFDILRRAPNAYDDPTIVERDQHPGYLKGKERCTYCASNPSDPGCSDWPKDAKKASGWACTCSQEECLDRYRNKTGAIQCVYRSTWCPGSNYCCVPQR